ncbi:hypothetical protein AL066_19775 [Pseudomonas nunensis]|nr:hypothetical protein AL066_19775 [Pseudomonas nunensis]
MPAINSASLVTGEIYNIPQAVTPPAASMVERLNRLAAAIITTTIKTDESANNLGLFFAIGKINGNRA